MPDLVADLRIDARWIVPMTGRERLLEEHSLIVHDGRIAALLPRAEAARRYPSTPLVERGDHLLLPGFVNACVSLPGSHAAEPADATARALAALLRDGVTCFAAQAAAPQAAARAAAAQGLRAVIGMPVADAAGGGDADAAMSLTEALRLHDEYKGHPLISTAFAPRALASISDATLARLALLADELELTVLMSLHESAAAVAASVADHGLRPIARLQALGLLTPALTAAHMVALDAADLDQAERAGIAVALCPEAALARCGRLPPIAALAAAGLRLCIGGGREPAAPEAPALWTDMKLLHYASRPEEGAAPALDCFDVLAAATCGGAAALGLDTDLGSLEPGKWADLCCLELGAPAPAPLADPISRVVCGGGRGLVTDVWVCGRPLLHERALTRTTLTPRTPR
jgi:5-methylthioadenosine/S-adenosylhomocysteine deaminase